MSVISDSRLSRVFSQRTAALAKSVGATYGDACTAEAAASMLSQALMNGHVCIELIALAQKFGQPLETIRTSLIESGVAICINDNDPSPCLPLVIDSDNRLYFGRYYEFERGLANALSTRARSVFYTTSSNDSQRWRNILSRYFGETSDSNLDWQRVAAAIACSGRLTIINGGPGTGKTTTILGILACLLYDRPSLRIALAAPTGKAAQHMLKALAAHKERLDKNIAARLPIESYTLHRLLGSAPDRSFRYHHRNPLPYDVIVIDEASMIDIALSSRLVDAVAPGARLILLGDKDQLAAVDAGAVFAELNAYPCYMGERSKRIAQMVGCTADTLRNTFSEYVRRSLRASVDRQKKWNLPSDLLNPPISKTIPSKERDVFSDNNLSDGVGARKLVQNGTARSKVYKQSPALSNCVVWLQTNYRFNINSPIGRLSSAIREGLSKDALDILNTEDARSDIYFIEDRGPILSCTAREYIMQRFSRYIDLLAGILQKREPEAGELFDALNTFRVLCAVRAGPYGVNALNDWITMQLLRLARLPISSVTRWFTGRPIIVTRNNYALGLFNGDIGVALPSSNGTLQVVFERGDGRHRSISPGMLSSYDTAFALTVHKSQGSEFERAALVLPPTFSQTVSRELIYTAVTRARAQITIIGTRPVIEQAINTPTHRDTGLSARLRYVAAIR
ncbi:AAA family ATPase [Candidatus Vallotiella sp. (ex Adelges kitamiensis)]|uniref:AAA family ATPase n=1 Tax=Candidatus Vallotiella sp. (ex Adelges kitamiensis) TaxID=2864217 RepID=UPI001CE2D566|nr:AAA family ATPase [Candidatus Vallotia sp. (ex Adelges kitamiensis)]